MCMLVFNILLCVKYKLFQMSTSKAKFSLTNEFLKYYVERGKIKSVMM